MNRSDCLAEDLTLLFDIIRRQTIELKAAENIGTTDIIISKKV